MAKKPREVTPSQKNEVKTSLADLNPNDFPEDSKKVTDLDIDLGDIDLLLGSDEEVTKIEQAAIGIRRWVETYLGKLDELQDAPKALRIRQENKTAVKMIHDKIYSFMNHHEAAYRQAAWVAFLVYKISNAKVQTYIETINWLDEMVEDRYLEDGNDHAPLQAWNRYFWIPTIASFTRPEFEEAKQAMNNLVKKITQITAKARQGRASELQEEANLEPTEIFEGKQGRALLFVPPQISKNDSRVFIRREGYLFVDSKSEDRIYPLEGIGSFEESVAEAAALGIFVKSYTLGWDWPPAKKNLLKAGLSDGQVKSCVLCWHLLKRAKEALKKSDQYNAERMELSKEVSISEEDFFLEGRDGCALVDFEGVWETWSPDKTDKDGKKTTRETISSLFILIERKEGDKVSIVSCPEHLKQFFFGCMGTYNQMEKFFGVPQPLQSVLQAQYGAVQTKNLLCV